MGSRTPQTFTEALNKFLSLKYNTRIAIRRSYDDWTMKQIWSDYKMKRLRKNQMINLDQHTELGSDIACAKFVINYCNGQVRNENERWINNPSEIPKYYTKSFKLTAIDAKKSQLVSESIDNFVGLDHLESINLSYNDKLDNFACDQLSRQFRNSKTLKEIDISYNSRISVYGLEILFRIPSLKKIIAVDTLASQYEDIDLFVLAAEDEKQCNVLVHNNGKKYVLDELEELRSYDIKMS